MAIKTIILLRHGQYESKPVQRLTALGRQQAVLAGKRLAQYSITKIYSSNMPRAQETARIVNRRLKKSLEESELLCECVPGFPMKERKKHGFTDAKKLARAKKQADQAFKKFFQFSKTSQTELLVCHGNIIRYLICKSLGIETDTWTKFDIKQCGLCIVELDSKTKKMMVITHGDVGHIPLKLQSFM